MLTSRRKELEAIGYEGRTVLVGRSSSKYAWADLGWRGWTEETCNVLPDGRNLEETLNQGVDLSSLPPVWMALNKGGALGDLLWNGGMMFCFVSDRFVDAVGDVTTAGYQVLPLDGVPKRGPRFAGYNLLVPDDKDADAHVRGYPFRRGYSSKLDVSAEVRESLKRHGATELIMRDAVKEIRELLDSD
ncbi:MULTISPECIES: hypothetical protein [unclassified Microbacterium]|uniref:hypothetical protein n=1 Tax=unclassified Microbacterium TaxID=2609290 RepID=UPI003C2B69A1